MRNIDKVLSFFESIKVNTDQILSKYTVYDDSTFKLKNRLHKVDFLMGIMYFINQDQSFKENPKKVTELVRLLTNNGFHPAIVNGVLNRAYDITISPDFSNIKVKNITFISDLLERAVKSSDFSKLEKYYKLMDRSSIYNKFIKSYGRIK